MKDPFEIHAWKVRLALTSPYRLSFGPVSSFETIFVQIDSGQGHVGLGEATFLTGYTDEVFDESWSFLKHWLGCPMRLQDFKAGLSKNAVRRPFLASALRCALDMASKLPILSPGHALRVPILGLLQGETDAELQSSLQSLVSQGYRTIKLKVGFEPEKDSQFINRVVTLYRAMPKSSGNDAKDSPFSTNQDSVRFRIDANQGFSSEGAITFLHNLHPDCQPLIELFEQPCEAKDWDAHARVVPYAKGLGIKLMLDESIYGEADIQRAADGDLADFIKVKLMKFEGLEALVRAIDLIKHCGMTPVLGNGVASDLNCWMEGCVADLHIQNAGEMNGYLKQRRSPLVHPLEFADGHLCAPAGWRPALNRAILDALQEDQIHASIDR